MLVQQMSLNNKPTPVSQKFVIGFLTFLGLGLIGIYILKKSSDKKQIKAENEEQTSNIVGEDATKILKQWKKNFDSKNLDGIVKTYTTKAILVSTFGGIIEGREAIRKYFKGLFEKEKLSVDFIDEPHIGVIYDLTIFTGLYQFNYFEDGKMKKQKARYSILCRPFNGKLYIIKQHSSVAN
jgi:hypothetical protein